MIRDHLCIEHFGDRAKGGSSENRLEDAALLLLYGSQTSLKWYSTIAVLSGTLAPAGTFLKNNDKICPAD